MSNLEFNTYLIEHPAFAARIVLLPLYDPELYQENLRLSKKYLKSNQKVIYIKITELASPAKSRIKKPILKKGVNE
ncbi:MAG: hypothetical protein JSW07_20510 [bacterium]|nr:MAG: hypothetical protein JSW07_20510 [bacterium]